MILEFHGIEWETINNSFSERYVNFLNNHLWESEEYFEDNKDLRNIQEKIDNICNQLNIQYTDINELHEQTVGLRQTDPLYKTLNDLIHYYEREEQGYPPRWGFRNGNSAIDLIDSDYEYFTVNRKYGYLYTMYPHVARHLAEAVMSDDPNGTIQPQTCVRPNFFCWLGNDLELEDFIMKKAKSFIEKYDLNYNLEDKKLAMGYIPFAKLKNEVTNLKDLLQNVSN